MNSLLERIHEVADVYTDRHFVYTGDAHGDGYVNYRKLAKNSPLLREACVLIMKRLVAKGGVKTTKPITVIGPQTMGAEMVKQLAIAACSEFSDLQLNTIVLKKDPETKVFSWATSPERSIIKTHQVVVFDDLLNAGTTLNKIKELVEPTGAQIIAIGVIGDRSGLSAAELGIKHVEALERFTLNRYENECPLCAQTVPIVRQPGHGVQFEVEHPDYPGGFVDL